MRTYKDNCHGRILSASVDTSIRRVPSNLDQLSARGSAAREHQKIWQHSVRFAGVVRHGSAAGGAGRGERLQQAYGTPTKLIRGQTRRQWPGRAGRKGRARGRKKQRAKKKPQGSWAGRRKHTWSAGVWCRVPTTAGGPHRHPPPSGKATWAVGGLPEVPCPGASVEGRACRAPGQPTYGGLGADEGGTGAAVAPPLPTGQDGRGGGAALNKFPNRNSFPPLSRVWAWSPCRCAPLNEAARQTALAETMPISLSVPCN